MKEQQPALTYPDGEIGELLRVYVEAFTASLCDPRTWSAAADEDAPAAGDSLLARLGAELIPSISESLSPVLVELGVVEAAVAAELGALVARRASVDAERAVTERFGGQQIHMSRDVSNWLKRLRADAAIRSGLPRDEAFKLAGLSRAAAYRALNRKRRED